MDKIIFVNLLDYVKKEGVSLPLGILSLATQLSKNKKYNIEVVDFQNEQMKGRFHYKENLHDNIQEMRGVLLKDNPKIISIYTMCNTYHIAVMLSKRIKEYNPNIKVVFGGPQATLTADETLKEFPWIDVIGLGEGENSIGYIVEKLLQGKEFSDERGVAYLKNGKVINNGVPKMIDDLDGLPMIDYSFSDMSGIETISIEAGRGCPFNCSFCSTKNFWKRKFRLKTPARMIKEIREIIDNYGIRSFSFTHDLFTLKKSKIIEICDLIKKEELDIKWACSARIDTIDEEMIVKMSESGCEKMFLGIETGSEKMQKKVNKNLDLSKVYSTINLLIENDIRPTISFIYGFPDETEDDLRATIKMIEKLENLIRDNSRFHNCIQLHRLAFFPGTELTERFLEKLVYSEESNSTVFSSNDFDQETRKIISNKSLFPQFYEYKTELRNRLTLLDEFLILVYLRNIHIFKETYKLIKKYYKDDFLEFFSQYKKTEEEYLRTVSFYNISSRGENFTRTYESIFSFIEKNIFGEEDKIIKEMARLEYSMADFLYKSDEEQRNLKFDLDVFSAKKNGELKDIDKNIEVLFIRHEKKMTVRKISR